jgi:hypothetical protein
MLVDFVFVFRGQFSAPVFVSDFMKIIIGSFVLLIFCSSTPAQKIFEIKDASRYFDIKISVETCEEESCEGKASFSFFKKGGKMPYQVIEHEETGFNRWDEALRNTNGILPYGKQSAVSIGDFNFDGTDDVAISNGRYGNYGAQSYEVYLSSRSAGKFVHNEAFSRLGQDYMGLFEIDRKKKTLKVFHKSGCCWHGREEYRVVRNRPLKVFYEEEDATLVDENKVKITTGTLVGGKWRTKVKYVKRRG